MGCPICLEDFTEDKTVVSTPCGHIFCDKCLSESTAPPAGTGAFHQAHCPSCRTKYNERGSLHPPVRKIFLSSVRRTEADATEIQNLKAALQAAEQAKDAALAQVAREIYLRNGRDAQWKKYVDEALPAERIKGEEAAQKWKDLYEMEHALLVAERLKHADTTPQLATSTIAYPSLIRQVFRSNDTRNEELTRENELKEKDREIEELKRKLEQEKATHRRTDGKLRLLKEEFEDLSDTCDAKIRELKTLENMLEKERAAHARTRNKMQAAEDDLRRASAFSTVRNTRRSTIGLGDQSLRSTDDTKILNTSKPSPSFSSYNDFSTADFAQSSHAALDSRRGRVLPLKLKQTSVKPLSTIASRSATESVPEVIVPKPAVRALRMGDDILYRGRSRPQRTPVPECTATDKYHSFNMSGTNQYAKKYRCTICHFTCSEGVIR